MKNIANIITSLLFSSIIFSSVFAENIQIFNQDHKNRIVIQNDIGISGDSDLFFGSTLSHALSWDNTNNYFIFTDDVNFSGNEIKNVRLENLSTAPICDNSSAGRVYHNISDTFSYVCSNSIWSKIDEEVSVLGGKLQPYFYEITPDKISTNETVDLTIIGGNFDEDTVFTLGSGILVNSITINSDKQATINVTGGAIEAFNISVDAQNDTLDDFGQTLTVDVQDDIWKLFAITDSAKCAESLPYGPNMLTETSAAYFSTGMQNELHSKFKQVLTVGGVTKYEILYDFGNTKTIKDRMNNAYTNGEPVTWTVTNGANTYTYGTHLWYFSDGASLASKWSGSGTRFSNDDGSWGANSGNVDGNGGPYEIWGQGNHNSSDASKCGAYYTNGSKTTSSSIKNFMYLQ